MVSPTSRKKVVVELRIEHGLSERRSCTLAGISRSASRHARREDPPELIARLLELAAERPRFGYRGLYMLLRRDGLLINHKRVYRMYCEQDLQVQRKKRKQRARPSRRATTTPSSRNEAWSMDFMSDAYTDGRAFRVFNVVDDKTKEAVAMKVGVSLPARRVIDTLDRAIEERGQPHRIRLDNGPEFISQALDVWAYERGIELCFSRPGKPVDNCDVESFNGRVRDECLNVHCFRDLEEAEAIIEDWRVDYNELRPQKGLGQRTPAEYAASLEEEGYPSSSTGQAPACPQPQLNNER